MGSKEEKQVHPYSPMRSYIREEQGSTDGSFHELAMDGKQENYFHFDIVMPDALVFVLYFHWFCLISHKPTASLLLPFLLCFFPLSVALVTIFPTKCAWEYNNNYFLKCFWQQHLRIKILKYSLNAFQTKSTSAPAHSNGSPNSSCFVMIILGKLKARTTQARVPRHSIWRFKVTGFNPRIRRPIIAQAFTQATVI